MDNSGKKRLGSGVAVLFLCPALVGALSGCNNDNCDDNRSTLTTSDDCGPGRRSGSSAGAYRGGGFGAGQVAPRSGGFGGFGRMFSGGS